MADEIKKDFRQELTDKFVAALEEGRIPWQRPWNEVATPMSAPVNAISGNQYQGGNRLVLTLTQMDRNYPDPRWLTFNQAKSLGGAVVKGEKGTQIEFWREKPFFQRRDVDVKLGGSIVKVISEKDGEVTLAGGRTAPVSAFNVHHDGKEYSWSQAERRLNTLVGQTHTIFNVQQCQDLKLEPLAPTPESKLPLHERGELLLEGMKADGVRFVEAPNRAFYRSASDTISLPPRDNFKSEAMFYGTALHESAHATGNEKRLNRDVGKNDFGSEGYAKEELIAEMTSAFLAAETGIPHDIEDHKAYIQSWADALKNDKNEIFRAAKAADQAANYMHDKAREVQMIKIHEVANEREAFADIEIQPLPAVVRGRSGLVYDEHVVHKTAQDGVALRFFKPVADPDFVVQKIVNPGVRDRRLREDKREWRKEMVRTPDRAEAVKVFNAEKERIKRSLEPASPEASLREIWTTKGISTEKQDAMIKDIAGKAKPGAMVGPFVVRQSMDIPGTRDMSHIFSALDSKPSRPGLPGSMDMSHIFSALGRDTAEIDVDAMLAKDHAAMEAGSMDRIYDGVMAKANKQLATGEISQSTFDKVEATYGKPDMSGMKDLSTHDVRMGDYKPAADSRVYVDRGILTIDHDGRKVSFGSAKAMEGAITEYGLTTKDLRTAYAVEQRQAEARLELDHSEAKDMNAWLDMAKNGQGELINAKRDYGIETPEQAQARNDYREADMTAKQSGIPDDVLDKMLVESEARIQAEENAARNRNSDPEPELDFGR